MITPESLYFLQNFRSSFYDTKGFNQNYYVIKYTFYLKSFNALSDITIDFKHIFTNSVSKFVISGDQ